jgi:uncharacterized protein (TIGR00297 family)
MGGEMTGEEEVRVWRKAIPEGRDRVQSRVLVWVVGCLLVWIAFDVLRNDYSLWRDVPFLHEYVLVSIGVSVGFAVLVRALRAATTAASLFGGMICLILMIYGGPPSVDAITLTGAEPLAMLFLLTFLSTRLGRRKKAAAGLAEGRKGRNAAQVIANLSVAALVLSPVGLVIVGEFLSFGGEYLPHHTIEFIRVMCLAALVEATADTVSSEIGQAFGGRPVMVLSLKRVEVGTDGAVSLLGSGAGILAGAIVAAAGWWGLVLSVRETCIALVAGVCGLFFDSLLGATLERRGWLGNDLVNFASTVFAAGMAALIYRVVVFGW